MRITSLFLFFTFSFSFAADSFKVMTLNTWMIPFLRKDATARAQIIGKEAAKYELVLLQEAFNKRLRKNIAGYATDDFENRYMPSGRSIKINSGMFALTSFKILDSHFVEFSDCKGIQCMSKKGVQHLRLQLPSGIIFDIFNTHLQAFQKDALIRKLQLDQAMEFLEKINKGEYPVIFAGDFNIISEIGEYTRLNNKLNGFKDVWQTANPNDPGYTWEPFINWYAKPDYNESTLRQRIDYIFVRDGKEHKWKIQQAQIILNAPQSYEYKRGIAETFASDHFGIMAELELISNL
jgi:endonuclease/exonuclease/phosphatase family metal-dependent hydrolase